MLFYFKNKKNIIGLLALLLCLPSMIAYAASASESAIVQKASVVDASKPMQVAIKETTVLLDNQKLAHSSQTELVSKNIKPEIKPTTASVAVSSSKDSSQITDASKSIQLAPTDVRDSSIPVNSIPIHEIKNTENVQIIDTANVIDLKVSSDTFQSPSEDNSLELVASLSDDTSITPTTSLHSHQDKATLALSSFLSFSKKAVRLNGSYDNVEVIIPVSKRIEVQSMQLHLVFANSLSLAKLRSQLRFRFNGHIIGQIKLDPKFPEGEVDLTIPVDLIHDGHNHLNIESSLYTPVNMPSFGSSELWAEINIETSKITLTSKARDIDLKFSSLQDLVSGLSWNGGYPLSVIIASKHASDVFLNAASHMIQGVAMLTEDVPVNVYSSVAEKLDDQNTHTGLSQLYMPYNDVDAVLIGTYDALGDILGEGVIDASVADEQLLLKKHPLNPNVFILIVAGKTEGDVLSASKHFTLMNLPLANHDHVSFDSFNQLSERLVAKDYSKVLKPMTRYNFSQLGIEHMELKKTKDFVEIPLRMPADLFAIKDNNAEISLHFTYAPGMGAGSRIDISLNGVFQYSITTDDPNGMLVAKYLVKLPLRSFKKGTNIVRIESIVIPGELAMKNEALRKNINISIYPDSIVRIPQISRYARLPDLTMLKGSGYPYVEHKASKIAVASLTDVNISSALTLAAKIAQLQKRPIPELTLTSTYTANTLGSVLFIGSLAEMKTEFLNASPFKLKDGGLLFPVSAPYSDQGVPHNSITTMVGFEHVIDAFSRKSNTSTDLQYLDMTTHAVISQFEVPWSPSDSMTLLMTGDAKDLTSAVYHLVENDLWQGLSGDTFIWALDHQDQGSKGYALELSDEYHTGSLSFLGKVAYYAILSPIYLLLGVIFLVFTLTWITRKLVILRHDLRT